MRSMKRWWVCLILTKCWIYLLLNSNMVRRVRWSLFMMNCSLLLNFLGMHKMMLFSFWTSAREELSFSTMKLLRILCLWLKLKRRANWRNSTKRSRLSLIISRTKRNLKWTRLRPNYKKLKRSKTGMCLLKQQTNRLRPAIHMRKNLNISRESMKIHSKNIIWCVRLKRKKLRGLRWTKLLWRMSWGWKWGKLFFWSWVLRKITILLPIWTKGSSF